MCRVYYVLKGSDCLGDEWHVDSKAVIDIIWPAYKRSTEMVLGKNIVIPARPIGMAINAAGAILFPEQFKRKEDTRG